MASLILSIIGLIVGVVATVLVSRYYFRRSFNKSLTPYIQFSSLPLSGIDPTARKAIEIRYHDRVVENLFEIQFLIANSGDKAIRDVIEPLTLAIPRSTILLDASILHVSPDGRHVGLQISSDQQRVSFDFKVLNSDEFFIAKLLLDGSPKPKDFSFTIVADELPPRLKPRLLPPDAVASSRERKFEPFALFFGIAMLLVGTAVAQLVWAQWSRLPDWKTLTVWSFVKALSINNWASFVAAIPALALIVGGSLLAATFFTEGTFPPPKRKYIVPKKGLLLRSHRPFFVHAVDESKDEV
jgi:hypothetical protein